MNFQQIAEKIKAGELTLNTCGHCVSKTVKEQILDHYEDTVANANGAHDNKWEPQKETDAETVNARMRELYKFRLEHELEDNNFRFMLDREVCYGCGKRLTWVLDGNKLSLRSYYDSESKNNFSVYPLDYVCPYAVDKPTKGEIKISSKMLISNFFRAVEDEPEGKKYSDEYSLSSSFGRENITKYKASKNVAYGQMGNMSIGVYLHPNKKSVIIGDACYADSIIDEMTEEELAVADENENAYDELSVIEQHQLIDTVSLAVWRWEVTDLNTIGEEYKDFEKDNDYRDLVELDVEHGTWEFEHYYYTFNDDTKSPIYAKLTLKE